MDQRELMSLVGKSLDIRGVNHLCIAAGNHALLLLQFRGNNEPVQYVVAHYPNWHQSTLVWDHGDYFPLFCYGHSDTPMFDALRDAALAVSDEVHVAMADDDLGVRCVGVFTREESATTALEALIARDEVAREELALLGKNKLTLAEYQTLYDEKSLDNAYWIDATRVDRPDQRY